MEEKKKKRVVREVSATPKTSPSGQNDFGKAKFQFGKEDDASWLIGGIVEKGVVEKPLTRPPSAPLPSVLPFPVARHRAHGPHWAPTQNQVLVDQEDEGEDEDGLEYDAISAFANPVHKKEKKGLDLSLLKELIAEEKRKGNHRMVKESEKWNSIVERVDDVTHASTRTNVDQDFDWQKSIFEGGVDGDSGPDNLESVDNMEIDRSNRKLLHVACGTAKISENQLSMDSISQLSVDRVSNVSGTLALPLASVNMDFEFSDVKEQTTFVPGMASSFRSNYSENHIGGMTLESEIDAENSAKLQGMSPTEIAEAQLELMERMNPSVLDALKKRGQNKLKKKQLNRSSNSNNNELGNLRNDGQGIMDTTLQEGSSSPADLNTASSPIQCSSKSLLVSSSEPSSSSLWDTWSARVEAVRNIRFSLDGSVVEVDYTELHVSVAERDFLRSEGDPGAAGYTILEAIELTRSIVPAQRALALHLLASVLRNALRNILISEPAYASSRDSFKSYVDWEAIWAYALGPEPKLVLSLRLCMDDNQSNVILACLKVIQCILSCDENENFYNVAEKTALFDKAMYTAPIFRSKPEVDGGFLQGGYWKYSAKPSNIVPYEEDTIMNDVTEGDHKIQDDLYFAGQDFAGGLVRMGILPRICYLIESNCPLALEDCLISILIALARHSPKSAIAIIKCPGLVQTIVSRYIIKDGMEIKPTKIKYVTLCKVLAQSNKKNCLEIIKNGNFRSMTWQLFQCYPSLDHWIKSGRGNCKLASDLMVEQLRFWKVCIQYGYYVSDFADIFPALCLWLNPPSFGKLLETSMFNEFALISVEAFLVLGALAQKLPKFYHQNLSGGVQDITDEGTESWSWSHVGPIVDLALKWLAMRSDKNISQFFQKIVTNGSECGRPSDPSSSLLWVMSAVLHMLSLVLKRIIPEDDNASSDKGGHVPWLPDFVPKIGLQLLKNDFFSLSDYNGVECGSVIATGGSVIDHLCYLRQSEECQTSLASVCCIYWLVQVIDFSDTLIQAARKHISSSAVEPNSPREDKALAEGVVKSSLTHFRWLSNFFLKLSASEWNTVQSVEKFGRGGPAPGVGVGWGASGGGFWSENMILIEADNRVVIKLLEMVGISSSEIQHTTNDFASLENLNCALGAILTFGPRDDDVVDKAFDILFQAPALMCLDHFVRQYFLSRGGLKPFEWEYLEEDFIVFSRVLTSHFKTRWLCKKKRKSKGLKDNTSRLSDLKNSGGLLESIPEEVDSSMASMSCKPTSLVVEWTHQRLPLPLHWFMSPITSINIIKGVGIQTSSDSSGISCNRSENSEVISSGLFFLLGIEAASYFHPPGVHSPIQAVPLVWKLHSLSVVLLSGMGVLDEKDKNVYVTLQELYGQRLGKREGNKIDGLVLDKNENIMSGKKHDVESLRFQSDIHDSYPTFIEALVEQYAALSYGDVTYGRQIAMYLRRDVESSVRLSAWKELSNASILELLPPLSGCIGAASRYLEPVEEDERMLEAYLKSWESGSLDKAAVHGSVAFTLVLHHLSSFIFLSSPSDKPLLRNKLVKALLRDFCRKKRHQGMMLQLVRYVKPPSVPQAGKDEGLRPPSVSMERRVEILIEACEGNLSLLAEVERLRELVSPAESGSAKQHSPTPMEN
uniref:Transcriptional elongation regulator MINIYO n=1 Tax=Kalanchoe fedtschenkoi TaxID=63787 RepID=A0A7N0UMK9_KALFE